MVDDPGSNQGRTRVKRPEQPQPLTLTEAIIPVASLIVLVGLSYFLFGDAGAVGPNQVALVVATMIAVFIGWRRGHALAVAGRSRDEQRQHGHRRHLHPVRRGRADRHLGDERHAGGDGLLRPAAARVPTISTSPRARSAASSSASIGSSWTVVGTIGIGFMGIASNMGLNPAIAAGAIISGAYFGDKSSPLSDSANLAAAAAGVDLYQHIRETLLTSIGGARHRARDLLHDGPAGRLRRSEKIAASRARSTSRRGCSCRWRSSSCWRCSGARRSPRSSWARSPAACSRCSWRPTAWSRSPTPAATLPGVARAVQGRLARAGQRLPVLDRHASRSTCWRRAAAWTAC